MSDKDEQFRAYQEDTRIPCRYGTLCYQKNAFHNEKYKHPPGKDEKIRKQTRTFGRKRKNKVRDEKDDSPERKMQKKDEEVVDEKLGSPSKTIDQKNGKNHDNDTIKDTDSSNDVNQSNNLKNKLTVGSLLEGSDINIENDITTADDAWKVISDLFLMEMPEDFFQFYEFCKNISKNDPLNSLKYLQLELVGPYDVFRENFFKSKVEDKEAFLRHWRYYYDPPEFQTIIKITGKDGLHYGYWRDDILEKPVFVAKNDATVDCIIKPVAENIFGAVYLYIGEKLRLATPFEKTRIALLQQKLKNYAMKKEITLDNKTDKMKARESKVVTRTFHKCGIVVPYNKKTQLGYRDLAVTDDELNKILKQIEKAPGSDERKSPMSKLEEVIRLATIAADECDFGACLELGHDLFSSGIALVESKALNMLSLSYNLLQRSQFLEIVRVHFKDRKKGTNLGVLEF